jgi:hypothetical protein
MSVSDLRARLKKATAVSDTPRYPVIPLRTCVDILLKIQPKLETKFWFTIDGKEIVTEKILEKEIISFLREKTCNLYRARISEIARELNMDEAVVEERCVNHSEIELVFSDAVLKAEFWRAQLVVAKNLLDKSGTLSLAQLADKLSLPLNLVTMNLVPHLSISSDGTRLVGEHFSQIISARVTGVVNGLKEPTTVKWISEFVGGDTETVREVLETLRETHAFGDIGNDDIFHPKGWVRNEADEADKSLSKYGWCTNPGLKALILEHGKKLVESRWKSGKHVQLSSILVTVDDQLAEKIIREWNAVVDSVGWCDMKTVLVQHTTFPPLTQSEYASICDLILTGKCGKFSRTSKTIIFDEERILSTMEEKLAETIRSVSERIPSTIGSKSPIDLDEKMETNIHPKCEKILRLEFGITDDQTELKTEIMNSCRIRIRDLLKKEMAKVSETRARPAVTNKLSVVAEEHIIERFFEIAEAIEGIEKLSSKHLVAPAFHQNLVSPFVSSIFTFCQERFNLTTEETDHSKIIKSVPSILEPVKEALKFFNTQPLDLSSYLPNCRNHLREIGIVVSDKLLKQKSKRNIRKIRSELLVALDTSAQLNDIGQFFLFEVTGCRFSWLSGDFSAEDWLNIFPPINDPQLADLIPQFGSPEIITVLKSRHAESSP